MYTYEQAQEILKRFTTATKPIAEFLEIDRILGQMMLGCNIEPKTGVAGTNRFSYGNSVIEYHNDMLKGLWLPTNQGIGFDVNGHVCDGAHRLKALVRATSVDPQLTVPMLVCGGLPVKVKRLVDKGRRRTKAQDLRMEGYVDTIHLQAAVRLVYCVYNVPYNMVNWEMKEALSSDDMLEILANKYPDLPQAVRAGSKLKQLMHASAASASYYIGWQDGPDGAVDHFNARLIDGLGLDSATDPIYRLREFFRLNKVDAAGRPRYNRIQQLAMWIKCFNAWMEGREIQQVVFRSNEPFPKIKIPKGYGEDPTVADDDDEQLDATDYLLQEEDEFQRLMKVLDKGPSK